MSYSLSLQDDTSNPFSYWHSTEYQPEVTSIVLVFLIISFFVIYYNVKIRKLNPKEAPKGLTLMIFNLINYFKLLVSDVLGARFIKWTPYFLTLFVYIWGCNLIDTLGFDNPTASTTVTFSMGIVTVIGSFVLGVRFQRSKYFLKYVFKFGYTDKKTGKRKLVPYFFNPLGLLDNVTPLLSISLRLWGNIFAGALILSLIYSIPMAFAGQDPIDNPASPYILIMSIFSIPFHMFFDLLVGTIQAYVFTVLTLSYWGNEVNGEEESNPKVSLEDDTKVSVVLNSVQTV